MDKKKLCAVVTGGARGIGAAIVERLAKDGFGRVVLVDLDLAAASEAAEKIDPEGTTVHPNACSVGNAAQGSETLERSVR